MPRVRSDHGAETPSQYRSSLVGLAGLQMAPGPACVQARPGRVQRGRTPPCALLLGPEGDGGG